MESPSARDPRPESPKLALGVPLARIVPRQLVDAPEVVFRGQTRSQAAERFRRLKTLLLHDKQGSPQVIVVSSSTPAEGKSLISLNLALAFALEKEGETLLMDADLRRPVLDRRVSPPPQLGLSEVLSGQVEVDHAILPLKGTGLHLLPAGKPARDPVELLSSEYCKILMSSIRRQYTRVIIDTPPILPFTDADVIGALADGIILVARIHVTPQALLSQAVASITSARLLGIVLNAVAPNLADRGQSYERYYDAYYERDKRS